MGRRRFDHDLAGEHDLLQLPFPDARRRIRDGALEALGRRSARDPRVASRVRVEKWERQLAKRREAGREPSRHGLSLLVRSDDAAEGQVSAPADAGQCEFGERQQRGRKRRPSG
jgi:hypothetical protein